MSRVIVCPHCFTTVAPMRGGECPACSKSTNETGVLDGEYTRVRIRRMDPLPKVCFMCGRHTDRTVQLYCESPANDREAVAYRNMLTAFIGFAMGWGIPAESTSDHGLFRIPRCATCDAKPVALSFRFENEYVDIVGHRELARHIATAKN